MGKVVALVEDLIFIAKMKETARQVGVELEPVGTAEALVDSAKAQGAALLIVDLNARSGIEALEQLGASRNELPVVAYLSHVQVELTERARATGCGEVMPRSKFSNELAEILARAKT